jgi:hypothetical protein
VNKENMFDPDLESVEFQALKFTAFLIGRVYFLLGKCELIFSNLSAAAALLVTFPAEGKSDKIRIYSLRILSEALS